MRISLEEARTLDAVVRYGGFAKAAESLKKGHSAVVYSLKSLETQTGLKILDRSQYRTRLTEVGRRVWEECKTLLIAEKGLEHLCLDLSSGWEPYLRIVVDGIYPIEAVLEPIGKFSTIGVRTKTEVGVEFLSGVERAFNEQEAHFMISIVPPNDDSLLPVKLSLLGAYLVVRKDHPLAQIKHPLNLDEMKGWPFLTVKGSDQGLSLSTVLLDQCSTVHLNDFHSKKTAILKGLGFGWLPKYLIKDELKSGKLIKIQWNGDSTYAFSPYLYYRGAQHLGRAAQLFLEEFLKLQYSPNCDVCAF